ncbi:MAG: hypothetical protein WCH31_03170 [Actinomycetes bacterium]
MRRILTILIVGGLLAGTATASAGVFPTRGKLVPGSSIAGVSLGDTQAHILATWGHRYDVCTFCKTTTWLYEYPVGDPLGAAVQFAGKRVVAVFTLGQPSGWGTRGLMTGDPLTNIYTLYPSVTDTQCLGYVALTQRLPGGSAQSFYSVSGVIYGFALTAKSQSICR